jgi:exonuclease III
MARSFKFCSLNLNGIRSASSKGLQAWVEKLQPDCMGVQEVKAQAVDVQGKFDTLCDMSGYFHYAEKKGYSGVGLYTRHEPSEVIIGLGSSKFAGKSVPLTLGDVIVDMHDVPAGCFIDDEALQHWKYQKGAKNIPRVSKTGYEYNFSEGASRSQTALTEPPEPSLRAN